MTLSAQKTVGFDVNPDACFGLTFGINPGIVFGSANYCRCGPQRVTLQASATNYVEVDSYGTLTTNITGFTNGRNFLYIVATGATFINTIQDWRFNPGVAHPLGQSSAIGIAQAPSGTSVFSIAVAGLAADASAAATGDVYVSANTLMLK